MQRTHVFIGLLRKKFVHYCYSFGISIAKSVVPEYPKIGCGPRVLIQTDEPGFFATLHIRELFELPTFVLQVHNLADEIAGPNEALIGWWDCVYIFLGGTDGLFKSAKGYDGSRRLYSNRLAAYGFMRRMAELPIANLAFP